MLADVNYVSVLAASVASFIFGFLWYSEMLFGKQWMALSGVKPKKGESMGQLMIFAFISNVVMACVFSQVLSLAGATTLMSAVKVGFWVWLGFIGTVTLGSFLWEKKPFNLWVLNNSYNLLNMVVMALVLTSI